VVRKSRDGWCPALAGPIRKWVRGEELTLDGFDSHVRQLHAVLSSASSAAPAQLPP